jgi:hypothetical protein
MLAAALSLLAAAAPTTSRAQEPTKADLDKARTLFQEAVALAAANNCAGALVKYKAVVQVKMTPQVAFNIAECEERLGRLVSALGNYRLAASLAGDDKRAQNVLKEVTGRIDAIEARLPKLTITRGKGADAATIELDGSEIGQVQLGTPMSVDPGPHVIVARSGNKEYVHETVTLAEKDTKTFDVKMDVPRPKVEAPVEEPTPEPKAPPPKSRVPGIAVTAVGGVALVAGAALLGIGMSKAGTLSSDPACKNGQCPKNDTAAMNAYNSGRTLTGAGEVAGLVGLVGAGVGIWLLVTSGPQKAKPTDAPAGDADKEKARGPSFDFVGWAPGANVLGAGVLGRF